MVYLAALSDGGDVGLGMVDVGDFEVARPRADLRGDLGGGQVVGLIPRALVGGLAGLGRGEGEEVQRGRAGHGAERLAPLPGGDLGGVGLAVGEGVEDEVGEAVLVVLVVLLGG